jgi:hypothetical protein
MDTGIRIRHVVSIAGAVRDKATLLPVNGELVEILEGSPALQALRAAGVPVPPGFRTLRIGSALVEILAGPPAFGALLEAQAADPAWSRRPDRPDRVFSQSDGIFCFVDLPPGPYRLRVTAPEMGTRYGEAKIGPFDVKAAPAAGPFPVARADVDLPPTRIHGVVTHAVSGKPIPAARVRLLGDTTVVKTGDDGTYDLSRQVAGKPTLQVSAPRFQPETRQLELAAGQERVENLALQPE